MLTILACLLAVNAIFGFVGLWILSEISRGISLARIEATNRGNGIADYLDLIGDYTRDIYNQMSQ